MGPSKSRKKNKNRNRNRYRSRKRAQARTPNRDYVQQHDDEEEACQVLTPTSSRSEIILGRIGSRFMPRQPFVSPTRQRIEITEEASRRRAGAMGVAARRAQDRDGERGWWFERLQDMRAARAPGAVRERAAVPILEEELRGRWEGGTVSWAEREPQKLEAGDVFFDDEPLEKDGVTCKIGEMMFRMQNVTIFDSDGS